MSEVRTQTMVAPKASRIYAPEECGADGYPFVWHHISGTQTPGIKDMVRESAEHRCERCQHPFRVGAGLGRWSPCDVGCLHEGPHRWRDKFTETDWIVEKMPPAEVGRWIHEAGAWLQVEAEYRVLTVHHLNGVKSDLRWWNLAALCQRCHLQIQGRVQMERVWPWAHSDWFRPHAAGWYAFIYLDEDITREQAIARMDELLALERAA